MTVIVAAQSLTHDNKYDCTKNHWISSIPKEINTENRATDSPSRWHSRFKSENSVELTLVIPSNLLAEMVFRATTKLSAM